VVVITRFLLRDLVTVLTTAPLVPFLVKSSLIRFRIEKGLMSSKLDLSCLISIRRLSCFALFLLAACFLAEVLVVTAFCVHCYKLLKSEDANGLPPLLLVARDIGVLLSRVRFVGVVCYGAQETLLTIVDSF
jgi:hypothetical protein